MSGESCTKQFYPGETSEANGFLGTGGEYLVNLMPQTSHVDFKSEKHKTVERPGMRQDLGSDFFEPSSCRKHFRWITYEIYRTWILFFCRGIGSKIKSNAQ